MLPRRFDECFVRSLFRSGAYRASNQNGDRLLLFIGIIDILQSYRFVKKVEHYFKSIFHDGVSWGGPKMMVRGYKTNRFSSFCFFSTAPEHHLGEQSQILLETIHQFHGEQSVCSHGRAERRRRWRPSSTIIIVALEQWFNLDNEQQQQQQQSSTWIQFHLATDVATFQWAVVVVDEPSQNARPSTGHFPQ